MEKPATSSTSQEEAHPPNTTDTNRQVKKRKKAKQVVGTSYTFGDNATFAQGDHASATRNEYGPLSGRAGTALMVVGAVGVVVLGIVVYRRITAPQTTHIGDVITVGHIGDVNNNNHAPLESPSVSVSANLSLLGRAKGLFTAVRALTK